MFLDTVNTKLSAHNPAHASRLACCKPLTIYHSFCNAHKNVIDLFLGKKAVDDNGCEIALFMKHDEKCSQLK